MVELKEIVLARLKAAEVWPFNSEDCGAKIAEDRFYGFGDSGSLWGSFNGYATREECVNDISGGDWPAECVGTKPDDLGDNAVTALSGREFIDKVYEICDYNQEAFDVFGKWCAPCTTA